MSRVVSPISLSAVLPSGTLGSMLTKHAFERCRMFFHFVVTLKLLVAYTNNRYKSSFSDTHAYTDHATHQEGSGFRQAGVPERAAFDKADVTCLDTMTGTNATRTDACHLCNLGLDGKVIQQITVAASADLLVHKLIENLVSMHGSTQQLPQAINLGPDKQIDQVHRDLAAFMLADTSGPIFSRTRIRQYADAATARLEAYKLARTSYPALVAAAQLYIDAYQQNFEAFSDSIYSAVWPDIVWACGDTSSSDGFLNKDHFVA
jgi:hypothetical protein